MATATAHRSVQSSELSRNPASVFRAVEEGGPVHITRRDGEDLVLSRAQDDERERRALAVAAQIIAGSLAAGPGELATRLVEQFPWAALLRPGDRQAFASEIVEVTRACAAVGRFERLLITFEAWRSTAEAIAAGYTSDSDLDWLDEPTVVTDPRRTR